MQTPHQTFSASRFTIDRIVDGDTLMLDVLVWEQLRWRGSCRLAGINCWELSEADGRGELAKGFTTLWCEANVSATLELFGLDKYRRPLIVLRGTFETLNESLVKHGHAVRYR